MNLIVYENGRIKSYSLSEKDEYTIGRRDTDITLETRVSGRVHGVLKKRNDVLTYTDINSRNGTFYNDIKVNQQNKHMYSPYMRLF